MGYDDPETGFVPGIRLQLKRGDTGDGGKTVTLDAMIEAYFAEKRNGEGKPLKVATVAGYTHILRYHFASWFPLPLKDIVKGLSPDVVIERYKQAEKQHGPYGARNAFVMLSAVLNYARVKYPVTIKHNPLQVLSLGKHMRKIVARTDRLNGNDFKRFYEGIQGFNEITRDCYLFCLYHGTRSSEAAGLRWEHVDFEKLCIRVPDTKNRHELHVPLSSQSLALLKQRQARNPDDSPWVFPSLFRQYSHNKSGHVRLMSAELRAKTGLKEMTVHGLRRTFITTGRQLKFFEDVERLTNHIDSSVSGRHYDGTGIEDLRQPLQAICDTIERYMIEGVGAKVIKFPGAVNM